MLCTMLMAYCTLMAEDPLTVNSNTDTIDIVYDSVLTVDGGITINNLNANYNKVTIVLNDN